MAPDERTLRGHLAGGGFRSGVESGMWRLLSLEWPFALVAISAAPRGSAPTEFVVRFELSGYPNVAPTGGIWDAEAGTSLPQNKRPKGDKLALVFRADRWVAGDNAMYAPWDRLGLQAHPNWQQEAPHFAWNSSRDLTFILENLHGLLNSDEYIGV